MADLEQYLIARVLPNAYDAQPGRPKPRYSKQQARQVLTFLARQMNQDHTRDLAWWQIPRWAPTTPRILASMLVSGVLGAILGGMAFVLDDVLVNAVQAFAHGAKQSLGTGLGHFLRQLWTGLGDSLQQGLAFGLGVGLPLGIWFGRGGREPKRVRTWRAISVPAVLTAGLVYGLLGVIMSELVGNFVSLQVADVMTISDRVTQLVNQLVGGLTVGFTVGLPLGLSDWHGEGQGSPQELVKIRRRDTVFGLVCGTVLGLVVGVGARRFYGLGSGLVFALVITFVVALMPRLAGRFVAGFAVEAADGGGSPQEPLESRRDDRVFGRRVGLVLGVGVGLGYVLVSWYIDDSLASGLQNFLPAALPVGIVYGITSSVTWPTILAWRQLRRSRQVPAVGLIPFLEDARNRDILRTVGAVYQFRHATLQDQLAGQTIASPATSSATKRPS